MSWIVMDGEVTLPGYFKGVHGTKFEFKCVYILSKIAEYIKKTEDSWKSNAEYSVSIVSSFEF